MSSEATEIVFGCTMPMTGDPAVLASKDYIHALDMWVWWASLVHGGINVRGKVFKPVIKWLDNQGNPSLVKEMTEYLIENEGATVMFGPYSSTLTPPATNVSRSHHIVTMSGGASASSVFRNDPMLFSTLSSAEGQLLSGLMLLRAKGAKTVVSITQQLTWSLAVGQAVNDYVNIQSQGKMLMVYEAVIPANPTELFLDDLIFNLTRMQKPDVFVGAVYFQACSLILKSAETYQYKPKIFLMSLCVDNPQFISSVGQDSGRYILGGVQWNKNLPFKDDAYFGLTEWTALEFYQIFLERYNMAPSYIAAAYFVAGLVVTKAIENANSLHGDDIAVQLGLLNVQTFYGTITFNSVGQNTARFSYIQYDDVGDLQVALPQMWQTASLIYPVPVFPNSSTTYRSCIHNFGSSYCQCVSVHFSGCLQIPSGKFSPKIISYDRSSFTSNSAFAGQLIFGLTLSMTGNPVYSSAGQEVYNALDMWVWWTNTLHGGIRVGNDLYQVKIKWLDNNGNIALAQNMTKYFIDEESTSFMFGPYSSDMTLATAPLTEQNEIIMVTGGSSAASVFANKKFTFTTLSPASQTLIEGVKALQKAGAKTVVNIFQKTIFAEEAGQAVRAYISSQSLKTIKIIYETQIPALSTQTHIDLLLSNLTQSAILTPDIFVGSVSFDVCVMILHTAKKMDYKPGAFLLTLCVDSPGFVPQIGIDSGRYIIGPVQWNSLLPYQEDVLTGWSAVTFAQQYRNRYNTTPSYVSAAYFAAGLAFVHAAEISPTLSTIDIALELTTMSLQSFYGPIEFSPNMLSGHSMAYVQWDDTGTLQVICPEFYQTGDLIYPTPKNPQSAWFYKKCMGKESRGETDCTCKSFNVTCIDIHPNQTLKPTPRSNLRFSSSQSVNSSLAKDIGIGVGVGVACLALVACAFCWVKTCGSFEETPTPQKIHTEYYDMWVIPKAVFKQLKRLPRFEEAKDNNCIIKKKPGIKREQLLFISHRWLTKNHPDNDKNEKLNGIQRMLGNCDLNGIEFIWMDYCCIPQDPENAADQVLGIFSLPSYVESCRDFAIIVGQEKIASFETYQSRGWCRLEQFVASAPRLDSKNNQLRDFKMWTYNRDTNALKDETTETLLNPFHGHFRKGDVDKEKIALMLLRVCIHVLKNSGVAPLKNLSEEIGLSSVAFLNRSTSGKEMEDLNWLLSPKAQKVLGQISPAKKRRMSLCRTSKIFDTETEIDI